MNLKKLFKLHKLLVNSLSKDLVVSLILDGEGYFISISAHKSKMEFKTDRELQTCKLTIEDLNANIDIVADEITRLYKNILFKPDKGETK